MQQKIFKIYARVNIIPKSNSDTIKVNNGRTNYFSKQKGLCA